MIYPVSLAGKPSGQGAKVPGAAYRCGAGNRYQK
jgi:hypothetical protein